MVKNGANVAAVNSEGEVPLNIAEDDDMIDYLTKEVKRQGNRHINNFIELWAVWVYLLKLLLGYNIGRIS